MRERLAKAEEAKPAPKKVPKNFDGKKLPRDVRIIEEVKAILDDLAIEKRDPILRRAFLEEFIAEAQDRLENLGGRHR